MFIHDKSIMCTPPDAEPPSMREKDYIYKGSARRVLVDGMEIVPAPCVYMVIGHYK